MKTKTTLPQVESLVNTSEPEASLEYNISAALECALNNDRNCITYLMVAQTIVRGMAESAKDKD